MTDLLDRSIAALRTHHDRLAPLAADLDDDGLAGPSGAAGWSIAQVLSHLGSQAEIMLAPLQAAIDGGGLPQVDNEAIWARWDASTPRAQAEAFAEHDARFLATLEGLSTEQRGSLRIDLGFLPDPVPLSTAVGMRLNEVAQHAWDVQVALDPAAEIDDASATALVEHFADGLGFLLGFTGKADRLDGSARVAIGEHSLVVDDAVSIRPGAGESDARFVGPIGAALRLLGGRLTPARTPSGVEITGTVSLDEVRAVFPGY